MLKYSCKQLLLENVEFEFYFQSFDISSIIFQDDSEGLSSGSEVDVDDEELLEDDDEDEDDEDGIKAGDNANDSDDNFWFPWQRFDINS